MLRYAISDVTPYTAEAAGRWRILQAAVHCWSAEGLDYVQLREKSLPAGELFHLAESLTGELRRLHSTTRLLINSRADIAMAAGAHGVHLTAAAGELTPAQVRELFMAGGRPAPVVSVSCYTSDEAADAARGGADLLLFGPVFEKVVRGRQTASGVGLDGLAEAVRRAAPVPVLALGGITTANTGACLEAGAKGVAGIRLFAVGEGTHIASR